MDPRLDAFLDGLLPPDEAARLARDPGFARELAAERAIDDALRRRFRAPEGLGALAEPDRLRAGRPVRGFARGRRIAAAVALAAAALLALAAAWIARAIGGDERGIGDRAAEVAALAPGDLGGGASDSGAGAELLAAGAGATAQDGTAAEAAEPPPQPRPDLESLVRRVFDGVAWSAGPSAGVPADLGARLGARYEACVDVETDGCRLFGPYAAPEWPSATVLVGICESGDPRPALLVVDDQTLRGCAYAPETGSLAPFYKEVGGLAVWEVSADDRPRLLDAVQACR